MQAGTRTDQIVRLHTDADNLVWYGDDGVPAENTCLDPQDFFDNEGYREELANARVIKLLGTRANAQLVVKLQERRAGNSEFKAKPIMLGSPACLPAAWLKKDPSAVLHHIWQPPAASSLSGHWHAMTTFDYTTYAMISTVPASGEVSEVTRRIAAYHPAWPALTFLNGADVDAGCQLLCHIIDPRWYQHGSRPGRQSRLHAYLGLTPANMAVIAGDAAGPDLHFNRATNAVKVWYNLVSRGRTREPGDFLLRLLGSHKSLARGLLRGTQRLVNLVSSVWLDTVRPFHQEVGFVPRQFFSTEAEGVAFEQHRAAFKRV